MTDKLFVVCAILVLTVAQGCLFSTGRTEQRQIEIFSEMIYYGSGCAAEIESVEIANDSRISVSKDMVLTYLLEMGVPQKEAVRQLKDPFVSKRLQYIMFKSVKPACEIASFYENEFIKEGWKIRRGGLCVEETNGGGDWLRVFTLGKQEVLLHIIGPWVDDKQAVGEGRLTGRTIVFRFLNCTPGIVFGPETLERVMKEAEEGFSVSK